MTTSVAPFGVRAVSHPSGSIRSECFIQTSIPASACYKGDPVKLTGADSAGNCVIAAGGDAIIGVFDGCEYIDATGKPTVSSYWPASLSGVTGIKWYVITDPLTTFEVQGAGAVASTAIGDSADLTIAAGNVNTGVSASYLTTGSLKGAATVGQWRIMGLSTTPNNAWGDTATVLRVTMGLNQRFTQVNSI